jgi:1-acyl-sn-glycerol-3-phosphate acyltransferase
VRDLVYPPVILGVRALFRALGLRFTIEGVENFPREGGAILASNHVSYLDFACCGLAALRVDRRVRFLCKESVFRHPVSGPLMRGMHHIPVDRDAGSGAFREGVRMLRAGEFVGIFPEATISRSFTVKEMKSGAVTMAAVAGVPVVPMAVWGAQRLYTKGQPRDWSRGKAVTVLVGESWVPERREDHAAVVLRLREAVSDLVGRAQRTYPDAPSGDEDRWWIPAHLGGSAPTPEEEAEMDEREVRERQAPPDRPES